MQSVSAQHHTGMGAVPEKGFEDTMKKQRIISIGVLLCLLLSMFGGATALAASYKNVYGKTRDKVRVRSRASFSAGVDDNIVRNACVYILESTTSDGATFVRVKYRDVNGDVATGWVCQNDGKTEYVSVLTATQAKSSFNVTKGELPSTRVGTMKGAASAGSSSGSGGYLKVGSSGTAVKNLQTRLKALGYYSGELTGTYGELTESAVKAYQKANGLYADGIAGPSTQEKIFGTSSSSSGSTGGVLKLNAQGSDVLALQTSLKSLGFYSGELTGNFGTKTHAAVVAFQRKHGLTADGVAGKTTLEKLASLGADTGVSSGGGNVSTTSTLRLGSQGNAVTALQTALKGLGLYTGEITGNFGTKTQSAVRTFQSKYNLTADGVAGKATLDKLNAVAANAGVSTGGTSLKYGSEGTLVSQLQTKLKEKGIYYGEITGHYGTKTVAAVKAYQSSIGLTADGIAGQETLTRLSLTDGAPSGDSGSGGTSVTLTSNYGVTTKDKVILRAYYTTSSAEKTRLSLGTYFTIVSTHTSAGYTWLKINVKNTTGYIRSDMCRVLTSAEASEYVSGGEVGSGGAGSEGDTEVTGMIIVTGTTVNLRASAGTKGAYVGKATQGTVYSYTKTQTVDGVVWYCTTANSWISGAYCRKMTSSEVSEYEGEQDSSGYYTLKYDMDDSKLTGTPIATLQATLKNKNMYTGAVTGHYGTKTVAAVKAFQSSVGMTADGIAGPSTQKKLYGSDTSGGAPSTPSTSTPIASLTKGIVYNVTWSKVKYSSDYGFPAGGTATLYDIKTGYSMNIKSQSNGLHADVEPLTAADTNMMLKIYGVTQVSSISYIRRPAILITSTGYGFAVSIYGQCHGDTTIPDNNYPGQFCVHFKDSQVHASSAVDADHQNCISDAANWAANNGYTVKTSF